MKFIIAILFILTSTGFAKTKKNTKPEIIGQIITNKEPILVWTRGGEATSNWQVSEDLIKTVQPILIEYIKQQGSDMYYYKNLGKYRCQYLGIVVNNHHQIYCSFFRYHPEIYKNWRADNYPFAYTALDGSESFYRFVYDINEGKCKGFRRNGPLINCEPAI